MGDCDRVGSDLVYFFQGGYACTLPRLSFVKLAGLVSFLYVAIFSETWYARLLGVFIAINGVVCHCNTLDRFCVAWDLSWNLLIILLVNLTTDCQPFTALVSVVMAAAYVLSKQFGTGPIQDWIHALFVQGLGAVALYHYRLRNL
jgi:hypothetical protein